MSTIPVVIYILSFYGHSSYLSALNTLKIQIIFKKVLLNTLHNRNRIQSKSKSILLFRYFQMSSNRSKKAKNMNWEGGQEYQRKSKGIKLAYHNFSTAKIMGLNFKEFQQEDHPNVQVANSILKANPDKSIKKSSDLVKELYNQQGKYIEFSSGSQNSSENYISSEVDSIDEVLASISKETQSKTIYFVSKLVIPQQFKDKVHINLLKVKGSQKEIPKVAKIQERFNIYLFQVQSKSTIKSFNFQMFLDGQGPQTKVTSNLCNYGEGTFITKANFSYSYTEGKIPTNPLQELVMHALLNEKKNLFENILFQATRLQSQINKENYKLDKIVMKAIQQSNIEARNRYLVLLSRVFGQISDKFQINPKNQYLQDLISQQIPKYKHQQFKDTDLAKLILGILLPKRNLDLTEKTIIDQILTSFFSQEKISLLFKFFEFVSSNKLSVITQICSYSKFEQCFQNLSISQTQKLPLKLIILLYYTTFSKNQNFEFIVPNIIKIFQHNKFSTNSESYRQYIQKLGEIMNLLALNQKFKIKNTEQLLDLCQIYLNAQKNGPLFSIMDKTFRKNIIDLINQTIEEKIEDENYFKVISKLYIEKKVPDLVQKPIDLNKILTKFTKKWQPNMKDIIPLVYYKLLEKKKFQQAKQISNTIIEILFLKSYEQALQLLSKGFSNQLFIDKQSQFQLNHIFTSLMEKQFDKKDIKKIISQDKWHNNYKFSLEICIFMVQYMINKISEDGAKNLTKKITDSFRQINDDDKKAELQAMVFLQNLTIDKKSLERIIFKDQRQLLVLLRVKKKNHEKIQNLKDALQQFWEDVKAQRLSYEKIETILDLSQKNIGILKILFEEFEEYNIIDLLDKQKQQTSKTLTKIKRFIDFFQNIKSKYKASISKELSQRLYTIEKRIRTQSIKNNLNDEVPQIKTLNQEVINYYQGNYFFRNTNLQFLQIEKIIKISNQCMKQMINRAKTTIEKKKQRNLQYSDMYNSYIIPETTISEIRKFYSCVKDQNIEPIVEIYQLKNRICGMEKGYFSKYSNEEKLEILMEFLKKEAKVDVKPINRLLQKINQINKGYEALTMEDLKQLQQNSTVVLIQADFPQKPEDRKIINELIVIYYKSVQKMSEIMQSFKYLQQMKQFFQHSDQEQLQNYDLMVTEIDEYEFFAKEILQFNKKSKQGSGLLLKQLKRKLQKFDTQYKNKFASGYDKMDEVFKLKNDIKEDKTDENKTKMILKDSKFIIEIEKNLESKFQLAFKNKKEQINKISLYGLIKQKEKILTILINMEELPESQKNVEEIQTLKNFEKLVDQIEKIVDLENQYIACGQVIMKKRQKSLNIKDGDLSQILSYRNILEKTVEQWKQGLEKLYDQYSQATLLQSYLIRQFYETLTFKKKMLHVIHKYSGIFTIDEFNNFIKGNQNLLKRLSQNQRIQPKQVLNLIQKFFKDIFEKNMRGSQMQDRHMNKIDIVINNHQEGLKGLTVIGKGRFLNLQGNHVLLCTTETTSEDILSFIDRALRDTDHQYAIIDLKQLTLNKQRMIIERIKKYRQDNKDKQLGLKLCIVSQKLDSQLVNFAKQLNVMRQIKNANQNIQPQLYKHFFAQRTKDVRIYKTKAAGLGKTTDIKQHCQRLNKEQKIKIKCCFFPISGGITQKQIFERLDQIYQEYHRYPIGLVIQLYNINENSVKIVNRFLTLMCLFRSYSQKGKSIYMKKNDAIFIQIENISNFDHFKKLTFLSQIKQFRGNIEQQKNFIDIVQLQNLQTFYDYVFYMLYLLQTNKINDKQTVICSQIKELYKMEITQKKSLLQQYFCKPLEQRNQKPSLYQYKFFMKMLYQLFDVFNKSYYLTKSLLDQYKKANKKLYEQYQLNKLRSEFLKVIANNCIEFIARTVPIEQFSEKTSFRDSQFTQKLRQFPFFILPNKDLESFSFIYKKAKQVPSAIKNYLIFQNPPNRNDPRFNNLNRDQIFNLQSVMSEQENKEKFQQYLNQVLRNISGNYKYSINCQEGYVINIDNFYKICLILQRMARRIPIILMGEAGVGKTALLVHVVKYLLQDQLLTFNIHAGVKIPMLKKFIKQIQERSYQLKNRDKSKKLWVFFDQFNTTQNLGYIKELICDKKFMGKKIGKQIQTINEENTKEIQKIPVQNVIFVAACNPYRRIQKMSLEKSIFLTQNFRNQESTTVAFKVYAPPHSLTESMWNYGSLGQIQSRKYVVKMLDQLELHDQVKNKVVECILKAGQSIKQWVDRSASSLRDVQRFRNLFKWFKNGLPRQAKKKKIENGPTINYRYEPEHPIFMAYIFCFILRLQNQQHQNQLLDYIQKQFNKKKGDILRIKETIQKDFYSRLTIQDSTIASNKSIRENLFTVFVSIMLKLPTIIIGSPGSSKTLSVRLLSKNLSKNDANTLQSRDAYLNKFPCVNYYNFQGSQACTSEQVQKLFERASKIKQENQKIPLLVFDQIGLAEKSPDNPLKVLHSWLQLSRQNKQMTQSHARKFAFVGISNWDLDLSKMSRLLVLRRPIANSQDLLETAKGISLKYVSKFKESFVQTIAQKLANSYYQFMDEWLKSPANTDYLAFFGLRDFYSLVKDFWYIIDKERVQLEESEKVQKAIIKSIQKNFDGAPSSIINFINIYKDQNGGRPIQKVDFDLKNLELIKSSQKGRFLLLIVRDYIDLTYLNFKLQRQEYRESVKFIEGTHFQQDLQNKQYMMRLLEVIKFQVQNGSVLVLNNLQSSIQTTLYDLFNKFYDVRPNGKKICNITTNNGNKSTCRVHQQFICIVTLNQLQVKQTEAPFLNRFEKHSYTIELQSSFQITEIISKLNKFQKQIDEICKKQELNYKSEQLILNCNSINLKGLVIKLKMLYPQEQLKQTLFRALKQMCMNSVQDFFYIFSYFMRQNGNQQYKEWYDVIQTTLQEKKSYIFDKSSIVFVTDLQSCKWIIRQKQKAKIQKYSYLKKQSDLCDLINNFLISREFKILGIELEAQYDIKKIGYIESVIQRCKQSKKHRFPIQDKQFLLIIYVDRTASTKQLQNKLSVSFFNDFQQITYDGITGQINKTEKDELFKMFSIKIMLQDAEQHFEYIFQNDKQGDGLVYYIQNLKLFKHNLINQQNILIEMCKCALQKIEGLNMKIKQDDIKQILKDQELRKKYKNMKEAMTAYIYKKKFAKLIKAFLFFLLEKQVLTSLNLKLIQPILVKQIKDIRSIEEIVARLPLYNQLIMKIFMYKLDLIKTKYDGLKRMRRDPPKQISIKRIRLFPFSKIQFDALLSVTDQKKNLYVLAQNHYNLMKEKSLSQKAKAALQAYKNFFRQKSTFIFNDKNGREINLFQEIENNQTHGRLLFLDFLIEFLIRENISYQYLFNFEQILKPFLNQFKSFDQRVRFMIANPRFWASIFRLFICFYEEGSNISLSFKYNQRAQLPKNLNIFLRELVKQIQENVLNLNNLSRFSKTESLFRLYTTAIFQLQNLIKGDIAIQRQTDLYIKRDFLMLLQFYDNDKKQELFKNFIGEKRQQNLFEKIYEYLNGLIAKNPKKKKMITEFLANKLFKQWFKQIEQNRKLCIKEFISKVDQDEYFAHNSVNTLNYLIFDLSQISFDKIQEVAQKFTINDNQKTLQQLGDHCKKHGYKNNLSVLFVNLFYQQIAKLTKTLSDPINKDYSKLILTNYQEQFKQNYKYCHIDNFQHPLAQLFGITFVKFYLFHYIQCLTENADTQLVKQIGKQINKKDSEFAKTVTFYCVKLLRQKMTPKQIKMKYINVDIFPWKEHIQKLFEQCQSKSFNVPKETCDEQAQRSMKEFEDSQGLNLQHLQTLFSYLQSPKFNNYSLLNFFIRFFYTRSYQKQSRDKIMEKAKKLSEQNIKYLGKTNAELLIRYASSQFDENLKVDEKVQVNQDDFIIFEVINLFFNSNRHKSPLASLFYNEDGTLSQDFYKLMDNQFVIGGEQNRFVDVAKMVYGATSRNNIGVYLCSSECDYIYFHEDCGWPYEKSKCLMCGKDIGKGSTNHSIARANEGGRRLISSKFVNNSNFYIKHFQKMDLYWDCQRQYIQTQIYRMKQKKSIKTKEGQFKLTGYKDNLEPNDRISLTTNLVNRIIFDCIFYGLLSLGYMKENNVKLLLTKIKNVEEAKTYLLARIKESIKKLKQILNLQNKFQGWMFGIIKEYFKISEQFEQIQKRHKQTLFEKNRVLVQKLRKAVQTKAIHSAYFELYQDMAAQLQKGLVTKHIEKIRGFDGSNVVNRDIFQMTLQSFVKEISHDNKFDFAQQNFQKQGKMQYPYDLFLTQDDINQKDFPLTKIFKVPGATLKIANIVNACQVQIKENYSFLHFILKCPQLESINHYYTVITFVNKLMPYVDNKVTRQQAKNISIGQFLKDLKRDEGAALPQILNHPQAMLKSWEKLANSVGVLQYKCKVIGKMNNLYNLDTPLIAFVLDNLVSENFYGMMICSVFHNFAKTHNQLIAGLNARKNQMQKYRNLNLLTEDQKLSPQQLRQSNVFLVTEQQTEKSLIESSIFSVKYGDKMHYYNFEAIELHFIKKLEGKCQIKQIIEDYIGITFNGQAFSQKGQGSNTINEVRQYNYDALRNKEAITNALKKVNIETLINMRGTLQNAMKVIRNVKGNTNAATLNQLYRIYRISVDANELQQRPMKQISISQIVEFYQIIQYLLKEDTLNQIDEKFKQKLSDVQRKDLMLALKNINQSDINDLENALVRFISRILLTGVGMDEQLTLMQYLPYRQDFWPFHYDSERIQKIQQHLLGVQIKHICQLLELVEKMKPKAGMMVLN